MRTPLTQQQLEIIRTNAQTPGVTAEQTAEQLGLSTSTIWKAVGAIHKGKFDKLMERAKYWEERKAIREGKQEPPTIDSKPESKIGQKIFKLYQSGITKPSELKKKLGTSDANVYYWLHRFGWKKKTARGAKPVPHQESTDRSEPKWIHNAKHLREQGLTYNAIAEKLSVPRGAVAYHLHGKEQYALARVDKKEHLNGDAAPSSTGINKHVFIGYAFAKVEEYISLLATRANFPPAVLRTRLAELLGHPSFRETDRD